VRKWTRDEVVAGTEWICGAGTIFIAMTNIAEGVSRVPLIHRACYPTLKLAFAVGAGAAVTAEAPVTVMRTTILVNCMMYGCF